MKLFHESENKYYELLTYLLNGSGRYSEKEIDRILEENMMGEQNYEVEDTLFSRDPDLASVFRYENGEYLRVIQEAVPIRANQVERQAFYSLADMAYARSFLQEETINKIKKLSEANGDEWKISDLTVKNQYAQGASVFGNNFYSELKIIMEAIKQSRGVIYDNIVPGKFAYKGRLIFPLRIEYSFINDQFRICAYNEEEDRFVKLNLASVTNLQLTDRTIDNLEQEYKEFLENNTKRAVLEIEAVPHVVERSFRIFSYYDRMAGYDKNENKYILEIFYLKSDENELIRDILSLGYYAVGLEPVRLRRKVLKRIRQACDNYMK